MKGTFRTLLLTIAVLVMGCVADTDDESSTKGPEGGDKTNVEPEPINVALQESGGKATASYDDDHAPIVNDGFLGVKPYWAGNARGDHVTIEFDEIYLLETIKIYTDKNTGDVFKIKVSMDGEHYTDVGFGAGKPMCDDVKASVEEGLGVLSCHFNDGVTAGYLRIVIDDPKPGQYPLREVAAWGL